MAKTYTALMLLVFAIHANADEVRLSTGINIGEKAPMGQWWQPPLPYYFENKSQSYSVEIVKETDWPWLKWSFGYHDLGTWFGGGKYVSDSSYEDRHVEYPCERCDGEKFLYYGEQHGRTRYFTLVAEPEYSITQNISVGMQLGAAGWYGNFFHKAFMNDNRRKSYEFEGKDVSAYASVFMKFGNFHLSVYRLPQSRVPKSMVIGNHGWRIGYEFPLN